MGWWKKILSTIPVLFAVYEVGKSTENNENQALEKFNEQLLENLKDNNEDKINSIDIIIITTIAIMATIYIIKLIKKMIQKSVEATQRV